MKRLYRSATEKKIAGICGGIGEMLDADPTFVRLLTIFLAFITGILPLTVTYLIAWWVVPVGERESTRSQ
jgi:phage shock protein C